jgi:hypothetical protein
MLAQWTAPPSSASPDEQFELSIAFLLDGIAARPPKRGRR